MGFYWDSGQENGNYRDYRDYIGVMGIATVCWGSTGIRENRMETSIMGFSGDYRVDIGVLLGLWKMKRELLYSILGSYRDI